MAPEIIRGGEQHTSAVDIWAVGVVAFYLLTYQQYPFPGISKESVYNKILNFEPELYKIPNPTQDQNTNNAIEFIKKCLTKEKSARPSAKTLLDTDPWLLSVKIILEPDEKLSLIRNISQSDVVVDKHKFSHNAITSFISNVIIKSQDVRQIGKLFMEMNTARNGTLSREEEFFASNDAVRACLNVSSREEEIDEIFRLIDTNHNDEIEYSEFITACMDKSVQLSS